jgi:tRNA 2-thiouridine synthesizing protein A
MATVIQTIDLQGDVCPYTLVKSRIALEKLKAGEVLEVLLGNSESAGNVPRSLDLEGHEVLSVEQPSPAQWSVKIKRG